MTGRPISSANIENDARSRFGLPPEVQLVFYPEPTNEKSRVDILEWDVANEGEELPVLLIKTELKSYRIYAGIIAYMQSPHYVEDNCLANR